MEFLRRGWLSGLVGLMLGVTARAESIVFPPDAGVIDVTQAPYFATGDDLSDDTEALQQALLEHGNLNRIIYLPDGEYRISATLYWPPGENDAAQRATILQGQSRDGTKITLVDYAPGFGNSGRPRPMLWTGGEHRSHARNAVRNLTLHTGLNNPGAVGLQFKANQQGTVRDVNIVAGGGGNGISGIDLGHADQNGPLLLKNLRVEGFDVGIRTAFSLFSITAENLELIGQRSAGIRNSGQVLSVRRLRSTNSVPAVFNADSSSFVSLLDSTLNTLPAKRPPPAVLNRGLLFLRDVTTPGTTNAVENRGGHGEPGIGPVVYEYLSHPAFTLFPAPPRTLRLPVEETPELAWDPLAQWAGPRQFGGVPDDLKDDSGAIQAAIDSGATTVYLPNGVWRINQTIELRHSVRRLIGCEARVVLNLPPGAPAFRLVAGPEPVVLVERIEVDRSNRPFLEQASERKLVVSSCLGVGLTWTGRGEVFLEDVQSPQPLTVTDGRRLWARQLCVELEGSKIINDASSVWLLGLKTELGGTLITTRNGGRSELLGGLCVSSGTWKLEPMFSIHEAGATFIVGESSLSSSPFQTIVSETRKGAIRRLSNRGITADQPLPSRIGGIALPLYTGYDGIGNVAPRIATPTGQ